MGRGDRAFTYFKENAPSMQNDRAEIRKIEPYCYGQFWNVNRDTADGIT